jgi:lipid A ethanolaminephosphotransferase
MSGMLNHYRALKSKTVSSGALILGVSLFVALFSNVAFFATAVGIYGHSPKTVLFLGSLFLFITALFVLVLSAVCHRLSVKPLLIAFLLLSSVIAYFTAQYGIVLDYRMIENVLETDSAEAADLLNPHLLAYVLVLGVLPSLLIYFVRMEHPHWKVETIARLKLAAGAVAVIAAIQLSFGGHYAAMVRDHGEVIGKMNPTYALYSAVKLAVHSSSTMAPRRHRILGSDARIAANDTDRDLVIMVVGETARADHWSLNGYPQKTNPRLEREKVFNFTDMWSCGTSTAVSVPCMFSHLGRAEFDPDRAGVEDNALDIIARAGVSVLWRDNNSSSKGVADRVAYQDFRTPKTNSICEDGECRDEGMLVGLQDYIDAQKGDILIVLHQMGNHGPAYYKRYPKAFERFKPVCRTNDLGSCSSEEINNAYDNAILYTDYFLSKVIELLKKNNDKFETAMLYVSDHGESLGEYGLYLHGMPYLLAPNAQKHVPALMWFGPQTERGIWLDRLKKRRTQRTSQDNVFSTLLGLFEIHTSLYDPKMDLIERRAAIAAVEK